VIHSRRQRRWLNIGGVAVVIGLLGYAYFAQFVQGYEPCPLCIFQRVAMFGLGVVLLIAGLHSPKGAGARVYAALGAVVAGLGIATAGRHVYLQNLPKDQVPQCGPGFDYLFDAFPVADAVRMIFTGSGECAEINWAFLGLSMPGWVLLWFVLLGALAVVANWTRVAS
jgi:protein dithiol:quinone oxidoreductase